MNICEELKKLGIETTEEVEKKFNGEFVSKAEMEKKISKVENERDELKTRLSTAEETLKGFEGKDFDAMNKEIESWKEKAKEIEDNYNKKLAENEKNELLKEAFKDIEFTSEYAKKAIISQISNDITVKNGKLIGFNELLADVRTTDAGAFVNKDVKALEENKAQIAVKPLIANGEQRLTKADIMNIKDRTERHQKISENMDLFQ